MYYVYLHIDPETDEIVYIGKGIYGRAWDVTRARHQNSGHCAYLKILYAKGYLPTDWVELHKTGLSEREAFDEERRLIWKFSPRYNIGQSGERNNRSKLTDEQALEIFQAEGYHKDIAKKYGVSRTCVSMIKSRKQWRAVTANV